MLPNFAILEALFIGVNVSATIHFEIKLKNLSKVQALLMMKLRVGAGAKVSLECRNREGGTLIYSSDSETDKSGTYRIPVDGDHEEEICEIALKKSSDTDCSEVSKDPFLKKSARISLTKNNGISTPVRLANPLGFMKKKPLPECAKALRELGMNPDDVIQ